MKWLKTCRGVARCLFAWLFLLNAESSLAACRTESTGVNARPLGEKSDVCRHIIRVPLCRQSTDYTCGVASLQSILGYYGEDIREDTLAKELGTTSTSGTDCEKIVQYAHGKGYSVEKKTNADIGELKRTIDEGVPAIVVLQAWKDDSTTDYTDDWEDGHYVVAVGYDNDNLYFMDPSTLGVYTYIPQEEFLKRWHDKDDGGNEYINIMVVIGKGTQPVYRPDSISKLE